MIYSFLTSPALKPFRSLTRAFSRATIGVLTKECVVGGVRWSWIEAGPSDGEPLVLLHGFAGSKDNWLLVVPFLARRYRVICPDLPGFGESGPTASGDYSIGEQADRVVRFIDALALGPCHLGGNSMGGYIALAIALDAPDVVTSLLLLNNAGVDGPQLTPAQQALKAGHDLFDIRNTDDVDIVVSMLFHKPPYLPWLARQAIVARQGRRRKLDRLILDQILVDAVERPFNLRLDELTVPVLTVWGRGDNLLHVSAACAQHDAIARSQLVILDDVGHVPMFEQPLRTARAMLSFLAGRRG